MEMKEDIQTIHRLSFFVGYSLYLSLQKYEKKEFLQYNLIHLFSYFCFFLEHLNIGRSGFTVLL